MNQLNLPVFMEPRWFFPLFAIFWLAISALLSRLGGWSDMAVKFRAAQMESGERFRFVSGSMGANTFPVSYGGCLNVRVNDNGFRLSILFPFRFQSPPLFIPWSEVESVEEKKIFVIRYIAIRVRNAWPTVTFRGRAAKCIQETYARTSSKSAL